MKLLENAVCRHAAYFVQRSFLPMIAYFLFVLHLIFFVIVAKPGIAAEKETQATFPNTTDRILAPAVRWVQDKIPSIAGKKVDFFIFEYPTGADKQFKNEYYTDSCKERTRGVQNPVIYCNASLFYEIEAVLRSFLVAQASPRFSKDKELFALVERIQHDPPGYLEQIRKVYQPAYESLSSLDDQIMQHMKLMMLFFAGHELGHIRDDLSGRAFTSLLSSNAPLEKRVSEAVVRMCRHAEEFERLGFGLPGFTDAVDIKSEIRKPELKFRDELQTNYETCSQWYQDEISADQAAIQIILDHLASLDKKDRIQAGEAQNFFDGGLYFTGIYYLYKDLYTFYNKACGGLMENTQSLMGCMMQNRESYVKAASIFGVNHPFPLLRSLLALEKILDTRTNFFKMDPKKRTIWTTQEALDKLPKDEAILKMWYFSDLQKYYTLGILMDTPVKFAYVGCSTGYFLEIDKKRGPPQLLMMVFEPMEMVFQRLLRVP